MNEPSEDAMRVAQEWIDKNFLQILLDYSGESRAAMLRHSLAVAMDAYVNRTYTDKTPETGKEDK